MILLNNTKLCLRIFPNKETYLDVPDDIIKEDMNVIKMKFESDSDLFQLYSLKKSIDEVAPDSYNKLKMDYIPYSRMDRQQENRLFTLKYFAEFINLLRFNEVVVMEPHSDVSIELINNIKVQHTTTHLAHEAMINSIGTRSVNIPELFNECSRRGVYLVFPDKGAKERYTKWIKYDNILTFDKKREFNTGNIVSIEIENEEEALKCKTAIIIDDLCSRGGTFVGVASKLRELGVERVELVVTHCENTVFDGDLLKGNLIDRVYTTDSILDISKCNDYKMINKLNIIEYNMKS